METNGLHIGYPIIYPLFTLHFFVINIFSSSLIHHASFLVASHTCLIFQCMWHPPPKPAPTPRFMRILIMVFTKKIKALKIITYYENIQQMYLKHIQCRYVNVILPILSAPISLYTFLFLDPI
jgi:hypothetical protein